MRTWAKGTARAALLTASFVALGAGTAFPSGAFADTTSGESGVLGGNQINLPISAPIDASGNSAAVAGASSAASQGGASVVNGSGGSGQQTSGKNGVGSGNQVNAPISAPINACGNAIAIFGTADAGCKGGATVKNGGSTGQKTSGQNGVASGNQVNAPISAPVNACGNAVAVFGSSEAGCEGGAKVENGGSGGQQTTGANGVVAGNQVNAPISAPINVCGNAAAIFGEAVAGCEGGAKVKNGGHTGAGQHTSGQNSVLGGNQANAPISAPIDVCGNAVGNAAADCDGGASVRNGGHGSGGQTTSGQNSVLGGNQVNAPVSIPVSACGNAVAVLGVAGAACDGGAHVRSSSGGDQTTSGKNSVLGGNQVNAPVNIPVNVCGNAVAVLGDAAAGCNGSAVVKGSNGSGATTSGESGVGSGNQVNAPVKAPVDVCGNAVAVAGHAQPQCDDGPSWGGYHSYSRTSGKRLPGPAAGEFLGGLPSLPAGSQALPLGLTSALPALPQLPAQAPALPKTPVQVPTQQQLPTGRTTPADSLPVTVPGLPVAAEQATKQLQLKAPAVPSASSRTTGTDLPVVGQLAGALPLSPNAALPETGLPVDPAALLAGAPQLPVQLPATPATPAHARTATPVPAAELPTTGLPQLPALPKLPVTGGVKAPEVGGVTETLGAIKPMSATDPMVGEAGSSIWVLATVAMLTAVSGALALTRRVRIGRR
ncbi:chaplin family protein [Spirillospora sp. NPDC047279]|uniref:chaplin family protein n=1 Tax=Spirillospora sp. NPDC047279 TaxID=3155478 RepID=UPI0033ECCB78